MSFKQSPVWTEDVKLPSFPQLDHNLSTEIVVVGGGLCGLTTAYLLAKQGKKVAVVDRGQIGSGETSYTTAMITPIWEEPLRQMIKQYGKDRTKMSLEAGRAAADLIERIVREEKIDCEFELVSGYLFTQNPSHAADFEAELEAAQALGVDIGMHKDSSVLGFPTAYALEYLNQAKFHPLKYLSALAKNCQKMGVEMYGETECLSITQNIVKTNHGDIRANHTITTTHAPFQNLILSGQTKPMQTYVLALQLPKGILTDSIAWDDQRPYHYLRVDSMSKYDRLLLGGQDHPTGNLPKNTDPYVALESYFQSILPGVEYQIINRWSGQVYESISDWPYIGALNGNKTNLVATGFSGLGMTGTTLSAMINSELILEGNNKYAKLFTPTRLANPIGFAKRGMDTAVALCRGLLSAENNKQLKNNSGKVINLYGRKVAVYMDKEGKEHRRSAVCTHMGCTVMWNDIEKTWDCPCHGSRFDTSGKPFAGPATKPLEEIK